MNRIMHVHAKSLQSCPTLCNLMETERQAPLSLEIFPARVLEWAAISYSRGSS